MTVAVRRFVSQKNSLVGAVLAGGSVAGVLDLASAFITNGIHVPRNIAAGLIGTQSAHAASVFPWVLGVLIHFFIAYSAATVYCLASQKLDFLVEHWLVCGLFFGIAVFLVMYLLVMPLCAFHYAGPYQLRGLIQGILVHMFFIGLPISFSLHRLAVEEKQKASVTSAL